ncbi:hypothetical protein KAI58_02645 [Candidatus Gracilibacteria bacterium]|nr:hypothetical protein [Candidatus Gracilibacteria bacterium]
MNCGCPIINFFKKLFRKLLYRKKKGCLDGEVLLNLEGEDKKIVQNLDARIVVGKILEIKKHPDPKITKVKITKCDLGGGKTEQILCGGTNIKEGLIVPIATVGSQLSQDFIIGEREIRGIVSRGMICARAELGVSTAGEEKGQIWELSSQMEFFLGKSLNKVLAE